MQYKKSNRTLSLITLLFIYLVATIVGILSFNLLKNLLNIYINIFVADVVATFIVFLFGMLLKTASVYDPYWSVQTVVIYLALLVNYQNINFGNILFLVVILVWAIRLTWNFAYGFNDLLYVDWRYKKIQDKTGKLYPLVCFVGICLMPTIIVYLASLPAFIYVIDNIEFSLIQIIGLLVMLVATYLEFISDIQMKKFIKIRKNKNEVIDFGLWKYSRHPNYLGEILFWYGVAFVLILNNFDYIYYLIGAIVNTLLFVFISIPLEENHFLSYKPTYKEYINSTSKLIPFRKKH